MDLIERATVMHYHRHRIAEFGQSPKALGWKAPDSQWARFELIAQAADFSHCSVLDLGCGRADLKAFLDERYPGVRYTGVDQMPEFIEDAVRRWGSAGAQGEAVSGGDATGDTTCGSTGRARFLLGDFTRMELPATDYVIACGALAYRCAEEGFHLRMIRRMHAAARRALIFNMLDVRRFPEHPLLVGRDCDEVLDLCRRLSPHVSVSQGRLDDDMTFFVPAAPRAPTAPQGDGP